MYLSLLDQKTNRNLRWYQPAARCYAGYYNLSGDVGFCWRDMKERKSVRNMYE